MDNKKKLLKKSLVISKTEKLLSVLPLYVLTNPEHSLHSETFSLSNSYRPTKINKFTFENSKTLKYLSINSAKFPLKLFFLNDFDFLNLDFLILKFYKTSFYNINLTLIDFLNMYTLIFNTLNFYFRFFVLIYQKCVFI